MYKRQALARRLEGLSQIKLYLEEDETAPSRLDALSAALRALRARHPDRQLGPLTVSAAPLDEEDWANSWRKYYPPQFVGEKLCVCLLYTSTRPPWPTPFFPAGTRASP